MRIERIQIEGFGSFNKGIDVDLSDNRVAIIIGRNEAGKSTLMSALFGVLFGFRDQAITNKFEPWEEHDNYGGEVHIRTDAGTLMVVKRNFSDNTAEIGRLSEEGSYEELFLGSADPRGHLDDDIEYYRRLEELVGFQDESIFRGTVFMGQNALQTSITDQIRKLVSGTSTTDFKGVLHDLHFRFSELTMANPWRKKTKSKPRKIETLDAEIADRTEKLERAREVFMRTVSLEQEIKALEKTRQSNVDKLADTKTMLSQFERFCKLIKDRDVSNKRFNEANDKREKYISLRDKVHAIDRELEGRTGRFQKVGDSLLELIAKLKSETKELQHSETRYDREARSLKELRPTPNNAMGILLMLMGAGSGYGVLQVATQPTALVIGCAAAVLGLFLGRKLFTGFAAQQATLEATVTQQKAQVHERQETVHEIIAASDGLLGEGDPDTILAEFRHFRSLTDQRDQQISMMTVLGEWSSIDGTYETAADENLRCNGHMEIILRDAPYLTEIANDSVALAQNIEELRRRTESLGCEIEVSAEVLTEARVQLASISSETDCDLPDLEMQLVERKSRKERLEFERDALREVIDTLDDCIEEFQEGDLTRLADEVSEVFRKITSNRYTRVSLSPNMEPMLTKYDSTHITPDDLSQGTQDQLYFAIRIAIARHLSRKIPLPFFLDDPFVNFDQDRLDVTRELLESIDGHQVVLVTCDRNYESWSPKVLDLDRARAAAGEEKRVNLSA